MCARAAAALHVPQAELTHSSPRETVQNCSKGGNSDDGSSVPSGVKVGPPLPGLLQTPIATAALHQRMPGSARLSRAAAAEVVALAATWIDRPAWSRSIVKPQQVGVPPLLILKTRGLSHNSPQSLTNKGFIRKVLQTMELSLICRGFWGQNAAVFERFPATSWKQRSYK
jgi:hypothetical protein